MRGIRRHASTIVVAFVTAAVTAGGPVIAASFDANNADKVDGRHAAGAGAKPAARARKLVATNAKGRLPNNIIAKAPDANRLDGLDSVQLQRRVVGTCKAGQKLLAIDSDGRVQCAADRIDGGNAQTLDGLDSAQLQRRAARTVYVTAGSTPQQGGNRIRDALASIPAQGTSGGPWHSAGERWTVKLEPGVYDLNGTELVTRSHVDIEGAGRRHTVITCDCTTDDPDTAAVVHLQDDSELRALTVRNEPSADTPSTAATGVRMDSGEGSLRDVDVMIGPTGTTAGLRVRDATMRVWTSRVEVETLGGFPVGVWGTSSWAAVFVYGSEIRAPGGYAFRSTDPAVDGDGAASARVVNSMLEGVVHTGTSKCIGAYTADYAPRTATCGTS